MPATSVSASTQQPSAGRQPHARRDTACVARVAVSLVLVAAGFMLAACGATEPSGPPGITGTVTSLVPGDERPASILVEGPAKQAGAVADKALVTIAPQTLFFDAAGKPGTASGIVVGTKVKVWFSGAVAESYPVQGTAQDVQVVGP